MNRSKPSVGDVLLTDSIKSHLGHLFADDPDTRLIAVFLGTVSKDDDPDVLGRLEKLGWSRHVVYEVTAQYGDGSLRWVHRLNYRHNSPREAALGAVRFARRMLQEEQEVSEAVELLSITVRTMRLGEIAEDGRPYNGRGPAFVSWGVESEQSLDDLVTMIEEA